MSVTFTKLFSSITSSTIWVEDPETKVVWITMLAMADRRGRVFASIPGLAKDAVVSVDATRRAIASFLAPDPDSRTKDYEGRRIEEIDGGWRLLNHAKYRAIRDEEERRAYKTEKQRQYRAKAEDNCGQCGQMLNVVDSGGHNAEAEAYTEADIKTKTKTSLQRGTRLPEDFSPDESDKATAVSLRVDLAYEFEKFRDYFMAAPGQKGVKTNWHSTLKNWLRTAAERGSKNPLSNGHHPVNPDRYKREPLF